jgi:soluble lytic murein transglycosylase-like protein
MGGTAFASGLVVDDARIDDATLEQAARAAQDDAFPISLSAPVAARVRSLAGSERGRAYVRASISRSEATYGVMVDDALAAYGLPPQLAAVPLVESGYDNLPAHRNPVGAAGLWQFMPETARMYGLRVDATVDERLDPARATDAACRLLRDLRARHGDWGLALAAYNQGDQAVITAVAAEGTRDVGALIEAGALNDYAAQVLAAAMVLEQPALLD